MSRLASLHKAQAGDRRYAEIDNNSNRDAGAKCLISMARIYSLWQRKPRGIALV